VPKEPKQGFWNALKPLEQSVCQFENCKTFFLALLAINNNDPLEAGPGDVAQERGELLYQIVVFMCLWSLIMMLPMCILHE
jgi:hypothetical protein